jgi:ribosomal protein S18 acetylase RimI-like enzyme
MAHTCPELENPIWQATTTLQRRLACGDGPARRYSAEVAPFAALRDHSAEAVAALTTLVAPGERIWLFKDPPPLDPGQWRPGRRIPGFRMVLQRRAPEPQPSLAPSSGPPSRMLDTVADADAMQALKGVAFPGFFGRRTPEMGRYRGIRMNGELVAMAGERLALPGYREVSAVCTHPAHLGRGYARRLTREAAAAILADGDTPFLHVAGGNARAIAIYERLGFTRCADVVFVELERLGATIATAGGQ